MPNTDKLLLFKSLYLALLHTGGHMYSLFLNRMEGKLQIYFFKEISVIGHMNDVQNAAPSKSETSVLTVIEYSRTCFFSSEK